jgi:hypothetical protein
VSKKQSKLSQKDRELIKYQYVICHKYPPEIHTLYPHLTIETIQNEIIDNFSEWQISTKPLEEKIKLISEREIETVELFSQSMLIAAHKMRDFFLNATPREVVGAFKQLPSLREIQALWRTNRELPTNYSHNEHKIDTVQPIIDQLSEMGIEAEEEINVEKEK